MAGPLSGVRVLDMTSNIMGPYASLLLADMGADVCKIESPEGDSTRSVGPARNKGMSVTFLHANRNKRSVVLDLKKDSGLAALKRMVSTSDVLMYSLRPKTMGKLGLAYEDVCNMNPRLIYCGAFGFGQRGPYADRPAYDDLMQAAVGMPVLQARKSGPPQYVASAFADRVVGMAMSNAIAMALYYRERTGRGQAVQVPMFETFAHFVLGDHLYGHTFVPPIGDWGYERMMSPERKPYRTLDGHIGVSVYTDRHWQRFFEIAGRPEMAADPRYGTLPARMQHVVELFEFLAQIFETRSTDEWLRLLIEADIPIVKMNTPETLLDDEHMKAVSFFSVQEHPTEGSIRTLGIAQEWSESTPEMRYPAPRLGEHTVEVLREYGLAQQEVEAALRDGGARAETRDSSEELNHAQ
ncbi:formyl-CoA transferase [Paraburkholderia sp. HC6.4b]|uniref:CaiB/BaiF CoA transferase family protein n=1 Tax=unclassified Paraburkholderia TaxID=2615204 RepID=UPI00160F9A2D|nr:MULTISPECIES: CoA transferase [unclassified Paraburkholderia]MBB5406358.1 formyl-CoA transferase [Paraburkholderia sp. HC6.4b]MBB5448756.1 formyl-CoA transferase [Paraburkholderia sp. Kb1A]